MNLQLNVTTQGIRGGKNTHTQSGYALLSVKNNGQSITDISVDTFEGVGSHYKQRDNEHIDIYFPDAKGSRWTGTAAELKALLIKPSQQPTTVRELPEKVTISNDGYILADGEPVIPPNLIPIATELVRRYNAFPDMLEALKEAKRMYESVQPAGGWQGVYDEIRHAIEAATKP